MESAGPIVKGMIHQEQNVSFKWSSISAFCLALFACLMYLNLIVRLF